MAKYGNRVARTTIEAHGLRKEGGMRVTRGVVNEYAQALTEAEIDVRQRMGLVADDIHVETTYNYEISDASKHARRTA
jgi:hypothetical protein